MKIVYTLVSLLFDLLQKLGKLVNLGEGKSVSTVENNEYLEIRIHTSSPL